MPLESARSGTAKIGLKRAVVMPFLLQISTVSLVLAVTATTVTRQIPVAVSSGDQAGRPSSGQAVVQKLGRDAPFDPLHPMPVSYRDDDISMTLDFSKPNLSIVLQKKVGGQHAISLPEEIAQVNEIRRGPANRGLVVGESSGDLSAFAVLDLNAAKVSDVVWAYAPDVSPNARYVAFIKFFPTHGYGDSDGPEDHYMLYDLMQTASQNRPPGIKASRPDLVGTTVYPPSIGNREADNLGIPQGKAHIAATDGFFWSPTSDRYVFADTYQGVLTLVMIRLDSAGGRPIASTVAVPQAKLCGRNFCNVHLSAVNFLPEGVTVIFRGVGIDGSLGKRNLDFASDQFRPAE
jgi:hypothetical protein